MELLLDTGAEVNACINDKRFLQGTALQAAVESGMVTLLLPKGADPNMGFGPYVCPLIAAASKAEGEILIQLVASSADVNVAGGTSFASTPLISTAMSLPITYVEMLLNAGTNVNQADVNGDTALIVAAKGDRKSVEYLLSKKANIRAVSKIRGNALEAAFRQGRIASRYLSIISRRFI